MMNKMRVAVAVAGLAVFSAGTAQAQLGPTVAPDCNFNGSNPLNLPGFSTSPYACFGAFEGNSDALTSEITEFLNSQSVAITNGNTFSAVADNAYVNSVSFGTSGTFTFNPSIGGTFALSLKAGNSFSLYLFDTGASTISSLDYVTNGAGVGGGAEPSVNALSNFSMWIGTGGGDPFCTGPNGCVEVPEPTSFALYGLGLLGLGAMARRRRRQV